MKWRMALTTLWILLTACSAEQSHPTTAPIPTHAYMSNPASTYCEEQGNELEIRTTADGSQSGACVFADGSECDEWSYFRGECGPASPTARPIDPEDYQGWWKYTHPVYGFSIMLPAGWVVNEVTSNDTLMNGHILNLGGQVATEGKESIRMAFRRVGEDAFLWPTGLGPGEFTQQGTLDIADQPARRLLLVCHSGEVTAIWYHGKEENQPNIARGDLEFGFIFSSGSHCEPGYNLSGKVQYRGEMIIASLEVP